MIAMIINWEIQINDKKLYLAKLQTLAVTTFDRCVKHSILGFQEILMCWWSNMYGYRSQTIKLMDIYKFFALAGLYQSGTKPKVVVKIMVTKILFCTRLFIVH